MSSAALQIAPPDYDSLLGYEAAIIARDQNGAIFIAPDMDTFNAMESQGLPALFPRDGKWLMGHAALVEGMDLTFVFSTLAHRVEVGRIVAGYARGLFILSDESIGHNDTISFLKANDLCLDGLLDHAANATHYEYEQEAAIFNTITPLKSARKPQAEYPLEALGPIMGPIAKSIVSNIQVSTPLAAQSVLAVASLTAQQYADVQPPYYGAKLIPCMNYFLTIAGSGERKSAANNAALEPLVQWQKHLSANYEFQIEDYNRSKSIYDKLVTKAEAKAKSVYEAKTLIDDIGIEPQRPLSPSLILNEPTIEGFLKSAQHSHAGRAIITDEAGAFLGGHSMTTEKKQYTMTTLSKLWDASDIVMSRVGRETPPIRNKRLSMHLMGQSVIIAPLIADPLANGQGFLARFLTVSAPPRAGFRELKERITPADHKALNEWTNYIYDILSSRKPPMQDGSQNELKPITLRLDEEAFNLWRAYENTTERAQRPGGEYENIKPFASKAAEHVLRIAGIFTVIEQPDSTRYIDAKTISRAVDLIRFYADEHLRLMEESSADPHLEKAAQLMKWIKDNRGAYIYKNDLRQRGPNALRGDLDAILRTLCDYGHIRSIEPYLIDGTMRKNCYEVIA